MLCLPYQLVHFFLSYALPLNSPPSRPACPCSPPLALPLGCPLGLPLVILPSVVVLLLFLPLVSCFLASQPIVPLLLEFLLG